MGEECRASVVLGNVAKPMKVWDVEGSSVSCAVEAEGLVHEAAEAA